MSKMMNMFQNAANAIKQQQEERKKQEAADREWVKAHPASKVICDYFQTYFDKNQSGYNWLKKNHMSIWLTVKEEGVEFSWPANTRGMESFHDYRQAKKDAAHMIPFSTIYGWYGSNAGFFNRLDSKAARLALESMIIDRIQTLPHMKFNGMIGVKLFQ